ncbi:GNAT family N-acetyltransferase [Roseateles oligotrophus]|uniref:GNAT family N-acetyltransferase n=1 Tax=Roseateles oligotrophus TaxID=1769250 RepID=A0ABT2YM52_9BURK|nr:GNAT family N-acetyltransferase [Roseateles oligotrophus]MCV2371141.1 GNAT family N-acetyltransferase [Roseateles oligotrophus]
MINVRDFQAGDEAATFPVFFSAIHEVASAHYSPELIEAWAPHDTDPQRWAQRIQGIKPFIAMRGGEMVGYADLQDNGYIDHFFVSARAQRIGVASALMRRILQSAAERGILLLYSDVSLSAQGLYQRFGFVIKEQQTFLFRGLEMSNARMELRLALGAGQI